MESYESVSIKDLVCLCFYAEKFEKVETLIKLDPNDLNNILKQIDWVLLSRHQYLSEPFIIRFEEHLSWLDIMKFQRLSLDFIRNNLSKVYRYKDIVSKYQILTEETMDEFANLLNWYLLSKYQTMSEEFIEKHAHKVDWNAIFKYKSLTKMFKEKHKHKITDDSADDTDEGQDVVGWGNFHI